MKRNIIVLVAVALIAGLSVPVYAGFNCITEKRGVNIAWFGKGGDIEVTKVRQFTSDFKISIDLNKKGNTIYSGAPSKGDKIKIPKGTKEIILYISSGEGEICYSRSK